MRQSGTRGGPVGAGGILSRNDPDRLPDPRMPAMPPSTNSARSGILSTLAAGFRFSWAAFFIILLVNTGIAVVFWIEDPRPFWHPLLSVQCDGLAIAYCVNAASPWASPSPLRRLAIAVAIGATIGIILTILLKGYSMAYVMEHQK